MLNNLAQQEKTDLGVSFFLGTVVSNEDPDKLRRVKVTIPSLLVGEVSELPYIAPFLCGPIPTGSNAGSYSLVPRVGDKLLVGFQQGSLLHGYYFGSPTQKSTLVSDFSTNYPNRYGFKDHSGNVLFVDTQSNQVQFKHSTGTLITIQSNGNLDIVCPTSNVTANVNVVGNVNVTGDIKVTGDTIMTGDLTVTDQTNLSNLGINGDTRGVGNVYLTGRIEVTDDVVAGTVSLRNHKHSGIFPGSDNTNVPNV